MRYIFIISLTVLLFIGKLFGQIPCSSVKIETPVVEKPTGGAIASTTCTTLTVQWKGKEGQTYIVNASSKDPMTNQATPLPPITNIVCDNNQNCATIIPVSPGMLISWTVQAISLIDGRIFYSYPFRGEQDYAVPACEQPTIIATEQTSSEKKLDEVSSAPALKEKLIITNDRFAVYPNPVDELINIKWNSEYKGSVKLSIMDGSGKIVQRITFKKEQLDYVGIITVYALKPGLYFLTIEKQKGQVQTTKFIKN